MRPGISVSTAGADDDRGRRDIAEGTRFVSVPGWTRMGWGIEGASIPEFP